MLSLTYFDTIFSKDNSDNISSESYDDNSEIKKEEIEYVFDRLLNNDDFIPYKELIVDVKNKVPKKRKYVTGESDDEILNPNPHKEI